MMLNQTQDVELFLVNFFQSVTGILLDFLPITLSKYHYGKPLFLLKGLTLHVCQKKYVNFLFDDDNLVREDYCQKIHCKLKDVIFVFMI